MHQPPKLTCGNQSELVLLICHFLLLHVSPREEEAHHPLEELVHQLDGERHHVHLTAHQTSDFEPSVHRRSAPVETVRDAPSPQSVPSRRFLPQGGALCWRCEARTGARTDRCSEGGAPPATPQRDPHILKSFCLWVSNSRSLMVWIQSEQHEVGGLDSSSMHVFMNTMCMCVQHHTGSPTELLRDHVRKNQDGSTQTFGVVTIQQQCTYPHTLHRRNQAVASLMCKVKRLLGTYHSHNHHNNGSNNRYRKYFFVALMKTK